MDEINNEASEEVAVKDEASLLLEAFGDTSPVFDSRQVATDRRTRNQQINDALGIIPFDVAESMRREEELELDKSIMAPEALQEAELFRSGVVDPLMTEAGMIETAAAIAGAGLPSTVGKGLVRRYGLNIPTEYGGSVIGDIGRGAVAGFSSSLSEEIANIVLGEFDLREQKELAERGESVVANTILDTLIETGVIAFGRLSSPARQLVDDMKYITRSLDSKSAIVRAFVDDVEEFNKYTFGGVGGNAHTAAAAFDSFKRKVLRNTNWNKVQSEKIFNAVEEQLDVALKDVTTGMDEVLGRVRNKSEAAFTLPDKKQIPGAYYTARNNIVRGETSPTLDFRLGDLELEGLYDNLNAKSIGGFQEWSGGKKLSDVIDTKRGNTPITKVVRQEIDGLYQKYDKKLYDELVITERNLINKTKRLNQLQFEQNNNLWNKLSAKEYEAKEKLVADLQMQTDVLSIRRQNVMDELQEIVIPAEDLLNIRRGWDKLSKIDAKTAEANVASRLSYEANFLLANKLRTAIGDRITQIDPKTGEVWKNLNQTYGVLKRVEPKVRFRALPDQAADNFRSRGDGGFIANFFTRESPVGLFYTGMQTAQSRSQLKKMTAEGIKRTAQSIAIPAGFVAIQGPGTAAVLSRLAEDSGVPVREWAQEVANYGAEAGYEMLQGEARNRDMQMDAMRPLIDLKQERTTYITDLMNGVSRAADYAKQKMQFNNGTLVKKPLESTMPMPEEEPEETPKVEMEDTGLGTKKRK